MVDQNPFFLRCNRNMVYVRFSSITVLHVSLSFPVASRKVTQRDPKPELFHCCERSRDFLSAVPYLRVARYSIFLSEAGRRRKCNKVYAKLCFDAFLSRPFGTESGVTATWTRPMSLCKLLRRAFRGEATATGVL
jgi:hypothetical protein